MCIGPQALLECALLLESGTTSCIVNVHLEDNTMVHNQTQQYERHIPTQSSQALTQLHVRQVELGSSWWNWHWYSLVHWSTPTPWGSSSAGAWWGIGTGAGTGAGAAGAMGAAGACGVARQICLGGIVTMLTGACMLCTGAGCGGLGAGCALGSPAAATLAAAIPATIVPTCILRAPSQKAN